MTRAIDGRTPQVTTSADHRAALLHRAGIGNWEAFRDAGLTMERIYAAASHWQRNLAGVAKPWLCWNIDSDWCLVQQQLVQYVGWTPVVGYDPRVGEPRKTVHKAVVVNFNRTLQLPVLYPHFVMEFAFLFADRLAFWHSDLLVRPALLTELARKFERLPEGATFVTAAHSGLRGLLTRKHNRYWELIGCTTNAASRSQFDRGAGWWWHFAEHPNCPNDSEHMQRSKCYWDHGAGIYYWAHHLGGKVEVLRDTRIHEGHCTGIKNPSFINDVYGNDNTVEKKRLSQLSMNYNLDEVCARLGIVSVRNEL